MTETELERALKFPSFNWDNTLFEGKPTYPGAGAGLQHNEFPKKKASKAKKTKKGKK